MLDEAEILRREQEIIDNIEREEQLKKKYTWEDRMKADTMKTSNSTVPQIDQDVDYHNVSFSILLLSKWL